MRREIALAAALVVAVLGCSKTSEPEPGASAPASTGPATPAHGSAQAPTAPQAADITWTAPASWVSAPNPNPIRKATYKLPKAEGDPEDAELSITQTGGGVEANIKRWSGQFQGSPELKVTHRDVGPLKVTVVEGHGTFNGGGMPGGPASSPRKDWALLGAIVDSLDPPYFFKLTGPEKTVNAARADFDAFVGALKPK
jgi:hypothetical protein